MNDATPPPVIQEVQVNVKQPYSSPAMQSSARWFWWIAGLSLINSIVSHMEGSTSFVIGLGVTQVFDAIFHGYPIVAFIFDALITGLFVVFGLLGRKGYMSAFIIGGILYLLDAGIYIYVQDWLPVIFHAYAAFCIYRGAKDLWDNRVVTEVQGFRADQG